VTLNRKISVVQYDDKYVGQKKVHKWKDSKEGR
jgi:hypothetical protein